MAKPILEGKGWSIRSRTRYGEFTESGFRSAGAARAALKTFLDARQTVGKPFRLGPERTTTGQAMQDYGLLKLPFMKGALAETNRINRYLRTCGLATLVAEPITDWCDRTGKPIPADDARGKCVYFHVALEAPNGVRPIPRGLREHRSELTLRASDSDRLREKIARMAFAKVERFHIQELVDAMRTAGLQPSSIQLERALLRTVFNHAVIIWNWSAPVRNPAVGIRMPLVDNARDRILSTDEEGRLVIALEDCKNSFVAPTVTLLTETAMRSSEPLKHARWRHVDWERKILHLKDSKTSSRDVPLSPKAIEALRFLETLAPNGPDDRIVTMTYEGLKAAFQRACERSGIEGLHLHDLRHTAATRMALRTGSNLFLIQALTGHRTISQLLRYVNVKAGDVVKVLHSDAAPAVETSAAADEAVGQPVVRVRGAPVVKGNVVHVDFSRRAA